tara:strand:- start:679 stop:912 length:234 start_codon:yes stop_codon:yes gene_type:complete
MDSKYVHVFSGSMIEANKLIHELSEIKIYSILKDETKSAVLAGFGVPNFLYSYKVFVKKEDIERTKKIINNYLSSES